MIAKHKHKHRNKYLKYFLWLILIIYSIFILHIINLILLHYQDKQVYLEAAKMKTPLGKNYVYIIKPNIEWKDKVEEKTFLTIIPQNEEYNKYYKENPVAVESFTGRKIGDKTKIDLSEYIGEKVYIDGKYYLGNVLLLKNSSYFSDNEVVLRIDKITKI